MLHGGFGFGAPGGPQMPGHGPSPNQKAAILKQIKRASRQQAEKQRQLDRCLDQHQDDLPQPVSATFDGEVRVKIDHTNDEIAQERSFSFTPADDPPTLRVRFNAARTTVQIIALSPIETDEYSTPVGTSTTTVTRQIHSERRTGTFDQSSGHIEAPLDLYFDTSVDESGIQEDAPVRFDLTTHEASSPGGAFTVDGSPLNPDTGAVTIVGASTFIDNSSWYEYSVLGGHDVRLVAEGSFSPVP